MSDMKDSGLRLFGKNIQLNPINKNMDSRDNTDDYADNDCDYECTSSSDNSKQGENRAQLEKPSSEKSKDIEPPRSKKGSNSTITEDAKSAFSDKECSSQDSHNKDVSDQTSSTNPQDQKTLKKPDKILPCPRCNSMTTKFCYFNNYNVNQPRHFCKDCQRYWTAGGTMRNVPVGAGRRKSKNSSASQLRHLVVPGASEWRSSYKSYGQENANANSIFLDKGRNGVMPQGLPPQVPCFQGFPRPYTMSPVPWQPGFPVSFYSTSPPQWPCNTEDDRNSQSKSTIHNDRSSTTLSPNTSTTRKHARDGTMLLFGPSGSGNKQATGENKSENVRIVVPKTLNVSDPIEAANSSIWNTLQIKNSHHATAPIAKGGFFGQFQGNVQHESSHPSGVASSMALELNPVAFSRSLTFHETAQ